MKKPWVLSYPLSAQRRLESDWADAQADSESSLGAQSLCWFCHVAAHLRSYDTADLAIFRDKQMSGA